MTEEIIIDGVNVAECEQIFAQKKCALLDQIYCEDNPDCYYKQLKRAENTVYECHKYLAELEDKIERLEQENKELSFAIEKCLENAGIECDDEEQALRSLPMLGNAHYKVLVEKEELEQENRELKALNKKICEDCEKEFKVYWNALEEINITVKQLLKGVSSNCINNTPYLTALSLIENKINEVLNEKEL